MIWLTWRQFRAQAIAAAAVLAALAVALAVTGPHLAHLYDSSGIAGCAAHGDCASATAKFLDQGPVYTFDKVLFFIGAGVLYAAPPLMGAFWGAPLVAREIESGTLRIAWNQSVTRDRWLVVKLGFVGLLAMATAGLLSLMVSWWASPIYRAAGNGYAPGNLGGLNRFQPLLFGANGIVPVGYAAFGFVLGVTAGIVIRRVIPAMAVALAGYASVVFAWAIWVRPHLFAPARQITASNLKDIDDLIVNFTGSGNANQMILVTGASSKPGAWMISNQTIDSAGHLFTGPASQACINGSGSACLATLAPLHLRQLLIYQPASRFWAFQGYETGVFLALALLLAWFGAWWLGRRRIA